MLHSYKGKKNKIFFMKSVRLHITIYSHVLNVLFMILIARNLTLLYSHVNIGNNIVSLYGNNIVSF